MRRDSLDTNHRPWLAPDRHLRPDTWSNMGGLCDFRTLGFDCCFNLYRGTKSIAERMTKPNHFVTQLTPGGLRYQARRLIERAQARQLRGSAVTCPCCGESFKHFLPAGVARRPNARCPRCGSLERHRMVWLYLERKTDFLTAPHRVLDIAPEEFMQTKLRELNHIDYLSIDLVSPLAMKKMDLTNLELPDASFDVAFCNHVFEHIPDDRQAMSEVRRILKPGGWAILQTPVDLNRAVTDEDPSITDPQELLRRFGQADHVRVYGRDLFDRLRGVGWKVETPALDAWLSADEIRRYALNPREPLIVGRVV